MKKAIVLMVALNNAFLLHALPAFGRAHNSAIVQLKSPPLALTVRVASFQGDRSKHKLVTEGRRPQVKLSKRVSHFPRPTPVDFSQAAQMLELLSTYTTESSSTEQHVDVVMEARGTDLIIRQQNISRQVTREQYESLLRALGNEQPPKITPTAGERSRRGVEGLLRNVWPSLRWGIQNTKLLTERLNTLRQTIRPRRALALANFFFPQKLRVTPRLYVVMGGRAGAAALDGEEIYFDLLATSYYAETGTLAKFPTPEQVVEFFAHEVHHLLVAKHSDQLSKQLSLSQEEKLAFKFLTFLVSEGSATYLINEHRRAAELRTDPQFADYLRRIDDIRNACEEVPRRILDEGLAGETYEQAIAALAGSGWHTAGGLMMSVIDRAEGLEGIFKVLRDPRRLYVTYNKAASKLPKNSLPFPPFPHGLSKKLSEIGSRAVNGPQ